MKNIKKIIGNLAMGFDSEQENKEFSEALSTVKEFLGRPVDDRIYSLAVIIYEYGKTVGIRKERDRRAKTQRREELKLKYPEMFGASNEASDVVLEILAIARNLDKEDQDLFIKAITKMIDDKN